MRTLFNSVFFFGLLLSFISVFALPDYDPFADADSQSQWNLLRDRMPNLTGQTNAQGLAWFAAGSAAGNPCYRCRQLKH